MTEQEKQELREVCRKMRIASSHFYGEAIHTGNHAFIEFTGLMNEYIVMCEASIHKDIDFTQANIHTGKALHFEEHHMRYLSEKFGCIYGAAITSLVIKAE